MSHVNVYRHECVQATILYACTLYEDILFVFLGKIEISGIETILFP